MKKILIPYDFSKSTENTLNYGVGIAQEIGADIVLLNVTPYPVVTSEIGLPAFSYLDVMDNSLEKLTKLADRIKKETPSIQNIECFSKIGDIIESIVDYCKEHPVEFVVMGIYQHATKLMKVLIGSNAVETSHKTKSTVIVIPENISYKKPNIIAFAGNEDLSNEDRAFKKAKYISDLFKAELQLLHVVKEDHHFKQSEVVLSNSSGKTTHKLFIITDKKVSESLLGMLDNKLIDMIVIEPKEHTLLYKLFHESVSQEIAFLSPVPVVLVHS